MQDFPYFTDIYGLIESQQIAITAMFLPEIGDLNNKHTMYLDTIRLTGFIRGERRGEDDIEPFIAEIRRKEPLKPEPRRSTKINADKLVKPTPNFGIGMVKKLPDKTRFYIDINADQFDRLLLLVTEQALVSMQISYEPSTQNGGETQITSLTLSTDPDLETNEAEDTKDDYLYDDPEYSIS